MKQIWMTSLVVVSLMLVGCSNEKVEEVTQTVGIEHDLGSTVVEETPISIAVLEFSFLDALYRLGVNPVAIADDNEQSKVLDVTNKELTNYTTVGARKEPSLETLSLMDLDLIIADTSRHSQVYDDLNKIAPTISLTSNDSTYEQFVETFVLLAQIVDKEAVAEQILAETETKLEALKTELSQVLAGKTVLVVSPKNDKYTAHTSSSFVGAVLEQSGIQNAIVNEALEVDLSLEQVVELDADVIIYMRDDLEGTIYSEWTQTQLYNQLSAVINDEVYVTSKKEYWTQYRGFASIDFITAELENWFLSK
ncbi:MAG TPA: hypothetical protein DCY20_08610 [Firmicutes bacterium]|nr:hypothetical protein [Bacillota bacterium]